MKWYLVLGKFSSGSKVLNIVLSIFMQVRVEVASNNGFFAQGIPRYCPKSNKLKSFIKSEKKNNLC